MPSYTVGSIFDRTVNVLDALVDRYGSIASQFASKDPLAAEFLAFLIRRECETIAALEEYRTSEHPLAFDVHVRLSSAFPFVADEIELPASPTIDELAEHAERVDTLLEHLGERIRVYAASPKLGEILAAMDQIVANRRRQLAGALNEFQEFEPLKLRPR